jgi:hypothetical protein
MIANREEVLSILTDYQIGLELFDIDLDEFVDEFLFLLHIGMEYTDEQVCTMAKRFYDCYKETERLDKEWNASDWDRYRIDDDENPFK